MNSLKIKIKNIGKKCNKVESIIIKYQMKMNNFDNNYNKGINKQINY